jgi:hypothetical protein
MTVNYDNTLTEIEKAFILNWKKYHLKRTIMLSFVFMISVTLCIITIINRGGILWWILMGLSAGFCGNLWLKPRRARKRLIEVIKGTYEEKYTAVFNDKTIEIETVIQNPDSDEEMTDKSVYNIDEDNLYATEKNDMFLIYANTYDIRIFPKRCMSEAEIEGLREYFIKQRI